MQRILTLILFLAVTLGGGWLIGYWFTPGEWYAALAKPSFTPPNWVFPVVWPLLYVLIAIAGWRTLLRDTDGRSTMLWVLQLGLNFAWSPVMFGLHLIWPAAFLIIVAALIVIVLFIANRWNEDRLAAWLFVPYAAWVAFASALNLSVALLNPST